MTRNLRDRWKSLTQAAVGRRFVAVDFDSRQLRLVQAERAGAGVRILRVVGAAAPEGLDLADPKAMGDLLRSALKENRLAGWPVVMCVPRGLAVLKTLVFPSTTREDELAAMVQYQVEKELPFRPEEAVVDFTAESHFHADAPGEQSGGRSVLVAAVRVPVVDYYRQIALAAGVRLLRLGLRPYANHRCFAACMGADKPGKCAVVHLTADETEIDVFVGANLAFSRSALGRLPAAGQTAEAERSEAAAGVVTEVVRSLQSYQSVEGGGKVDKVYLAGGTGLEPRVARELSERLGVKCLMFDPAEPLRLSAGGGSASEFITALGLAVGNVAPPLDFLRPKRPSPPRNVKRTRALIGAFAGIVILLCAVVARGNYIGAKKARVQELQDRYRRIEVRKLGMDANARRVAAILAWERNTPDWLDHLALLSATFPSAQDAYTGTIASTEDGALGFPLYAASEQTITEIAEDLHRQGYEAKVGRQSKNNDPKYPHIVDLKVKPGPGMQVDLTSLEAVPRPADDLGPGESLPKPRPAQPVVSNPNPTPNPNANANVNPNPNQNPNPKGNPNPPGSPERSRGFVPPGGVNPNPSVNPGTFDPNRRMGRGRGARPT